MNNWRNFEEKTQDLRTWYEGCFTLTVEYAYETCKGDKEVKDFLHTEVVVEIENGNYDVEYRDEKELVEELTEFLAEKYDELYGYATNPDCDDLMNAVANFGGDPYLVETDEQAQELLESIKATASLRKIVRGDEDFETYMKRLDLTDENRPAAIYSGVDGSEFCFIYANDYKIR